jgi:putative glycosyltransferase (TIGR04372 family)
LLKGGFVNDIKSSGFFGRSGIVDASKLYQLAQTGHRLHEIGRYHDAVKVHEECLHNVYALNEINQETWSPRFLSYYFGAFLGHQAFTGLVLKGQDLGLVNQKQRVLPYSSTINGQQLNTLFDRRKDLELMPALYSDRFMEGPLNWCHSERLWMINTKEGFMEMQKYVDVVFKHLAESTNIGYLKLGEAYTSLVRDKLEHLGLPKFQPFVALHVRKKTWNPNDVRQADIKSYRLSVNELIRQGYFVIQFGTDPQIPAMSRRELVVIQGDNDFTRFVTPYLLSNCEFLVNTSSGPSYLSALFGRSVLQTNVVAFGKSAPYFGSKSFHLPKKWFIKGRQLSLTEILGSSWGYSYLHLDKLADSDIEVLENSPEEILDATIDILKSETGEIKCSLHKAVEDVQRNNKVPTTGRIAPSFLERNQDWLF